MTDILSKKYTFSCGPLLGRPHSDESNTIDPVHSSAWDVLPTLSPRRYLTNSGEVYVKGDWSAASVLGQANYTGDFTLDHINVGIKIKSIEGKILDKSANSFAKQYITDIFLSMNLAAPGCCNLSLSGIVGDREPDHLYNDLFDSSWIISLRKGWPHISNLGLKHVWSWLEAIQFLNKQTAQSPVEKAIFCLLQISSKGMTTPEDLIWHAHALEALYGNPTPPLGILKERIKKFLEIPSDGTKQMNKGLRTFYDLRNAFVHGGFQISHLFCDEKLDSQVEKQQTRLMNGCELIFVIVLATIQKLIIAGHSSLAFKEQIHSIGFQSK